MEDKAYICSYCDKRFQFKKSLEVHERKHEKEFSCYMCNRKFKSKEKLDLHEKGHLVGYKASSSVKHSCAICRKELKNYTDLHSHIAEEHSTQEDNINSTQNLNINKHTFTDNKALNRTATTRTYIPNNDDEYDMLAFFASIRREVYSHLENRCRELKHIRWYMSTNIGMKREQNDGDSEYAEPHFRSDSNTLLSPDDGIDHQLNLAYQHQFKSLDEFMGRGSGWSIEKVISTTIYSVKYKPLRGRDYFKLPKTIRQTGAVINVKNNNGKCFLYSILSYLHPVPHHAERVKNYIQYENELNMTGIQYPVQINQVAKFEKQNDMSINVIGFEDGNFFPLFISKQRNACHEIDLLYMKNGDNSHYCWIKNLSRLLSRTTSRNTTYKICRYCLQGFTSQSVLEKHKLYCSLHKPQHIEMPKESDCTLKFNNIAKQLRIPIVVYADFECFSKPIDTCLPKPSVSSITPSIKFEPNSYCYQIVCVDEKYTQPPVVYRGPDAASHFIDSLEKELVWIQDLLKKNVPIKMSLEEEDAFKKSTNCYLCNKKFILTKHRDHCHLSGQYRGAACAKCNMNLKYPNFVPVVLHNLKGFDSFLILEAIGKYKEKDIRCIPNNMNKFVSISLGNLRFIDSYQFIDCSLSEMVDNLSSKGLNAFKYLKNEIKSNEKAKLLLRKGCYCYSYVTDYTKFSETKLPAKECFYNSLTNEHISDEDYEFAKSVWENFEIKTLGNYHDLYLKSDVMLLASCFESFRDMCMEFYSLDCLHYYTCPGLSFDAALKFTKCELELLVDPDMHLFFEQGIRGGISVVSQRYSKANNKYIPSIYDPSKKEKYIMYFDCGNLYGKAMSEYLPTGKFRWLKNEEIINLDINKLKPNSKKGLMLEVDLEFDINSHEKFKDYPPAPENLTITEDLISPYSKVLWKKFNKNSKGVRCTKLTPNLFNKKKYVVHYTTLQLYLKLGLKLTKIHRAIEFEQSPFLKEYILYNQTKRREAKNEFEVSFFKLMINAIFGKTLENLRLRTNMKLVQTKSKLCKSVAKSSFKRFEIYNKDLVGVEHFKTRLVLNKPIFVGAAILDISKSFMFSFHYDFIQKVYGNRARLIFTDTDSLCYEIHTHDIYSDLEKHTDLFDFSNYPKEHKLYSVKNKRVAGKFKDELASIPIHEIVALKSKMYSILCHNKEIKTAKGINKATIKSNLKHSLYKECLFKKQSIKSKMKSIRPVNHKLHVINVVKTSLSAYDDKRYILGNGVNTLPYGYIQK